jgi:hypothetical protein
MDESGIRGESHLGVASSFDEDELRRKLFYGVSSGRNNETTSTTRIDSRERKSRHDAAARHRALTEQQEKQTQELSDAVAALKENVFAIKDSLDEDNNVCLLHTCSPAMFSRI